MKKFDILETTEFLVAILPDEYKVKVTRATTVLQLIQQALLKGFEFDLEDMGIEPKYFKSRMESINQYYLTRIIAEYGNKQIGVFDKTKATPAYF